MAAEFEIENRDSNIMEKPESHLYPIVKMNSLELPSIFNDSHSKNYLDCKGDNTYEDPRCIDEISSFSSVRADKVIPKCCGLYYFEIKLMTENILGCIGLGFSCIKYDIDKQLGMGSNSIGLHMMNRQSASLSISSKEFPITLTDKMRIQHLGIGINYLDNYVFCTVNGVLMINRKELPSKEKFPLDEIYPVISSQSPKCKFSVNLGFNLDCPFAFNFSRYKMTQLRKKRTQCLSQEYSPKLAFVTVHNLVSDYLLHHGYAEAWESLHKYDNSPTKGQSIETIRNRRLIQKYILDQDYLSAINNVDKYFPEFFQQFPIYRFVLKCRHFINLIVTKPIINGKAVAVKNGSVEINLGNEKLDNSMLIGDDCVKSAKSARLDPALLIKQKQNNGKVVEGEHEEDEDDDENEEEAEMETSNLCESNGQVNNIQTDVDDEYNDQRDNFQNTNNNNGELNSSNDEPVGKDEEMIDTTNTNGNHIHSLSTNNNNDECNNSESEMMDTETLTSLAIAEHTNTANDNTSKSFIFDSSNDISGEHVLYIIQYGKTLKDEAQLFYSTLDSNPEHQKGIELLTTAFSLIAYRDPYNSPFKDVLNFNERESLAHKINGAINGMLGRTTKAQLDCLLDNCLMETRINSTAPILSAIHPQLLVSDLLIGSNSNK